MIAGLSAIILSSPFALMQLWRFVSPGLNPRERRLALQLIGPVVMMFLIGMSFSYFVVFPRVYRFLMLLAVQNSLQPVVTANEYFGFLINLMIPFGFIFETPVLTVFLTVIGVVTPKVLRKMRRYAYVVCIILGTLISPPEMISHLSVTVPMILMYEISVGISVMTYKKKLRREAWWREDNVEKPVGGVPST